jgi:ferredoxin
LPEGVRYNDVASIHVDSARCDLCYRCVTVCKGGPLFVRDGGIGIDQSRFFGCTGCGQCMAVCPKGAVTIEGRGISPADLMDLPETGFRSTFDELLSLMLARRSIREFEEREIPRPKVDAIIQAASTAPMGIPPSEVELLVLHGREKVREFSTDMIDDMRRSRFILSPPVMALMRPFIGRDAYAFMKTFTVPLISTIIDKQSEGKDWLLYGAPLAILFHICPVADPADTLVSATYAMLAAESMGIGGCMIGSVGPYLRHGGRKIKRKYGIAPANRVGITMVLGYPKVRFVRAIRRHFSRVHFY